MYMLSLIKVKESSFMIVAVFLMATPITLSDLKLVKLQVLNLFLPITDSNRE